VNGCLTSLKNKLLQICQSHVLIIIVPTFSNHVWNVGLIGLMRNIKNQMNQRTKRGIESACRASKESEFPRYHLGAALYYKGVLLATGCNSTKTSPLQKRLNAEREFDPNQSGVVNSLHAEIRALSKVKYLDIDFSKSTLYVYREYANGNKAMARPCPACMKYIKELGIKHICYSTADGIAEERID
jgi:deoxycytidylate deaminase